MDYVIIGYLTKRRWLPRCQTTLFNSNVNITSSNSSTRQPMDLSISVCHYPYPNFNNVSLIKPCIHVLVRPVEYTHLSSSGLAVAIYADAYNDQQFSNRTIDDIGTFLRLAIRCTDIMEFIHRHSTVHGQINMDAFRWDGATGVRLWNFAVNGSSGNASFEKYLTSEGWRKYQKNQAIMQNSLIYISPEQTGRTTYMADHRSDIYSLGVVFFVLLTGQLPFEGGPLQIVNSILSRKMPAVHDIQLNVPEIISHIIEKMVCKTPDDRYMSMHGVKCDLEECLQRLTTGDTGVRIQKGDIKVNE